jgi:SAM-dependent methyltransferase
LAKLEPYNRWLVGRFAHAVGKRVLEIGAGFGNLTRHFVEKQPGGPDRELVVASDVDPVAVEYLKGTFRDVPSVRVASYRFPLAGSEREEIRALGIDTIVCCNVLEHIEDDASTLADMAAILSPGGRLVLLVPSLRWLYGALDEQLHHFRRYEKKELEEKLAKAGFAIEDCRFVNRIGILGWFVNGKIFKRRVLPKSQLQAFRLFLPLLEREETNPPSSGLSLLAFARKPD